MVLGRNEEEQPLEYAVGSYSQAYMRDDGPQVFVNPFPG
jgi:hypothetical protein